MAETHGKQNGKFRSSLFKGLQVEGSALVALRRARNTLAAIPRAGGELKKAPVGLFLRGDALGNKRLFYHYYTCITSKAYKYRTYSRKPRQN